MSDVDYRIENEHAAQCKHNEVIWWVGTCLDCGTIVGQYDERRDVAYTTETGATWTVSHE